MPEAEEDLTEIVWSKSALAHLQAIRDYIQQFNPRAADDIGLALYAAGNTLALFPHRGRPVEGTDLRELVTVHPYIIRYRIKGSVVRILRVRHAARRSRRTP